MASPHSSSLTPSEPMAQWVCLIWMILIAKLQIQCATMTVMWILLMWLRLCGILLGKVLCLSWRLRTRILVDILVGPVPQTGPARARPQMDGWDILVGPVPQTGPARAR